jgi:predicted peptidase
MNRKLGIIAVCIALSLAFSACSAGNSNAPSANETPSGEVTVIDEATVIEPAVNSEIKSVTAITEVFGTGQQVTAVAIDYGTSIDGSKLSADDFIVTDRAITKVYANSEPAKSDSGTNGNYVVVELELAAANASRGEGRPEGGEPGQRPEGLPEGSGEPGQRPEGLPEGSREPGQRPEGLPEESREPGQRPERLPEESREPGSEAFQRPDSSDSPFPGAGDAGNGSPTLGSAGDEREPSNHLIITITQVNDITDSNGNAIAPTGEAIESTANVNLVVDDFEQLVFTDSNYDNRELMYNLYVPKNYDASKTYPLVLFMVDAGGVGTDPVKTLTQGLGAIIWAAPEEQAKHECFVLAPQYTEVMANDNSETTVDMDVTIDLIYDLAARYSIDMSKLYNTGQSMGCMTSIAMDIKYPDLFAASFLVAGQWDASLVAPFANKPLWIVVSEGDAKASPGMDAITAELQKYGATVSKATWDSTVSGAEFDKYIAEMLAGESQINYTVFEGGSHTYTWQIAYTIEGIRDWLFKQTKP